MNANTRGQFKAAVYPRTVSVPVAQGWKKGGAYGDLPRVTPRQELVFVITLLNHLFNLLFVSSKWIFECSTE